MVSSIGNKKKDKRSSLFEISKTSSMLSNKLLARLCTSNKPSLWLQLFQIAIQHELRHPTHRRADLMFARNADLERFANSAASRAAVFF